MPRHELIPSPEACEQMITAVMDGIDASDFEGATDCPDGCDVEPDGYCTHGYLSAFETYLRQYG